MSRKNKREIFDGTIAVSDGCLWNEHRTRALKFFFISHRENNRGGKFISTMEADNWNLKPVPATRRNFVCSAEISYHWRKPSIISQGDMTKEKITLRRGNAGDRFSKCGFGFSKKESCAVCTTKSNAFCSFWHKGGLGETWQSAQKYTGLFYCHSLKRQNAPPF